MDKTLDRKTALARMRMLAGTQKTSLSELFDQDPKRLNKYVLSLGGLRADFSKQRIDDAAMDSLINLAQACDLEDWRERLFSGAKINTSEDRAVLHMALRGVGGSLDVQTDVAAMRAHMADYADKIRSEGRFKSIVHIGIGGSDLGPRLVADAFAAQGESTLELRFAENVDGASINDALEGLEPSETLIIIVSKSFGTQETKMNGLAAYSWLESRLGERAGGHMIAVTANRAGARAFGIDDSAIFDFWDWVGGRYSVWSAVGLSLQIAYGPDMFDAFLSGAAQMDVHFRDTPLRENLPILMGLIGIWNRNGLGYESLAIIPYARRLRKFSAFLQQLEMESNGKAMGREGARAGLTCPVIWGDEGTNGQHAFFQWLHQGPSSGGGDGLDMGGGAPVDFIAVLQSEEGRPQHHAALLANCFAQSEALMVGKTEDDVRAEMEAEGYSPADIAALAPQKTFYGNRPSTTILLDRLSPENLGLLIALYEHKVFVQSVIWEINAFDQWGVQLGKVLASAILEDFAKDGDVSGHDASTAALIMLARGVL